MRARPPSGPWITVATADSRRVAAAYAGAAYAHARSDEGYHASAVRIVTEDDLARLAGVPGVREARLSLVRQTAGGSNS